MTLAEEFRSRNFSEFALVDSCLEVGGQELTTHASLRYLWTMVCIPSPSTAVRFAPSPHTCTLPACS